MNRLFCKNQFRLATSSLQADLTMKNPSRRMEHAVSIRLFLFFSQKQTNTEAASSRHLRRTPVGRLLRRYCEASPWEEAPKLVPARVHRLGVFPAHGPGALPAHGPGALPGARVFVPHSFLRDECFTDRGVWGRIQHERRDLCRLSP